MTTPRRCTCREWPDLGRVGVFFAVSTDVAADGRPEFPNAGGSALAGWVFTVGTDEGGRTVYAPARFCPSCGGDLATRRAPTRLLAAGRSAS